MVKIDLDRFRDTLPKRAKVKLFKYKGVSPALECLITEGDSLSESDTDMVMEWQKQIIGESNILEFYSEETGRHWYVFLKRLPIEFSGLTDEDINTFYGKTLIVDGKLH